MVITYWQYPKHTRTRIQSGSDAVFVPLYRNIGAPWLQVVNFLITMSEARHSGQNNQFGGVTEQGTRQPDPPSRAARCSRVQRSAARPGALSRKSMPIALPPRDAEQVCSLDVISAVFSPINANQRDREGENGPSRESRPASVWMSLTM